MRTLPMWQRNTPQQPTVALVATSTTSSGGGGAVSSVTAGTSGNQTATPTTGAVVVDIVQNPTFTGLVTIGAATALTLSGTGANTITSSTTGANTAFVFNSNGAAPTGDLADFRLGGTTKASILNTGGFSTVAATGLALTGTTANTITSGTTGTATPFIFNNIGGNTVDNPLATFIWNSGVKCTITNQGIVQANEFTGTNGVLLSNVGGGGASLGIQSTATGTSALFVFSSTGAPTGDMVQFQLTSTVNAAILQFGGILPGNGTSSARQNAAIYSGTGVPNFSAANGSIYLRYDGTGAGSTLWYYNAPGASSSGNAWAALALP